MARKSRKSQEQVVSQVSVPSQKSQYRAGLYARISVENERKREADSIGTQIQLLKDFAEEQKDIQVFDLYVDDDITGTDFSRPEFSRMMNDARDGKINCIIVKDLSRFGRNLLETGEYIEMVFPFLGLRFISILDRFDSLNKQVDIGIQVKNMINELYAKDTSKKICSVMRSIQKQGKFAGGRAPYGYNLHPDDKHLLIADPETAPIVRKIFEMYAQGETLHGIATTLNLQGVHSPGRRLYDIGVATTDKFKNSKWYVPTLRRILLDPIYLGWMVGGRYASNYFETGKKGCKPVPREQWIITKGTHEAIITEKLFYAAQDLLNKNKEQRNLVMNTNSQSRKQSLFQSKLRCGECGKSMYLRRRKNGEQENWWYFCALHEHYGSDYCKKKAIKKEELETLVLNLIKKQMALFLDAKTLITKLNKTSGSKTKYQIFQEQIKSNQKQMERYIQLKASLYSDFAEGIISEEDYLSMGQEYAQKADEIRIFLSELEKDAKKYAPQYIGGEHWTQMVEQFIHQDVLDENMVNAFIKKITLHHDGQTEIEFNFRDEIEEVLLWASIRQKEAERYAG